MVWQSTPLLPALEAAVRAERPDVVLLDLSLPGKDGWMLAAALKADPATRATPIIGLTAHAMPGDRERALRAGCDEYESKPVDFPRLLRKMDVMLGAAAVAAEGAAARPAGELAGAAGGTANYLLYCRPRLGVH